MWSESAKIDTSEEQRLYSWNLIPWNKIKRDQVSHDSTASTILIRWRGRDTMSFCLGAHYSTWQISEILSTVRSIKTTRSEIQWDQYQWWEGTPESERYEECIFEYSRIVHTDVCTFTLVFSHGNKSRAGQAARD